MALAFLCRKPYFLGNVFLPAVSYSRAGHERATPRCAALATLSPEERARALERYRILQPCTEDGVPLTHVARH
jgi:hypothetical protein